jgi:hypothetical protein
MRRTPSSATHTVPFLRGSQHSLIIAIYQSARKRAGTPAACTQLLAGWQAHQTQVLCLFSFCPRVSSAPHFTWSHGHCNIMTVKDCEMLDARPHCCSKLRVIFVTAAIRWQYLLGAGKVSCWLCTNVDLCDELVDEWWQSHSALACADTAAPVAPCALHRRTPLGRPSCSTTRALVRTCVFERRALAMQRISEDAPVTMLVRWHCWLLGPTMNHIVASLTPLNSCVCAEPRAGLTRSHRQHV